MSLTAFSLMCSVLYLVQVVHAQNETLEEMPCSDKTFKYLGSDTTINITEACQKIPCIVKCCPESQIFIKNSTGSYCNTTNLPLHDYSDVEIYDKNIIQKISKSSKKFEQFTRIYSEIFTNDNCVLDINDLFSPPDKWYILEDGSIAIRKIHYYEQWENKLPIGDFCVEHQLVVNEDGSMENQLAIKHILEEATGDEGGDEDRTDSRNMLTVCGMLVSCVFLVLVLGVYAVLPQLRNLAGMMLMAYVATLTTAFVFRAVLIIGTNFGALDTTGCLFVGLIFYYAILASFTWMNVMSFDIWWSMRGFRKLRQIHRRGILVKFGWYSLYGWGAPLLLVLFIVVVDSTDMTHLPNFVKPHMLDGVNCFINENERQLYMNGPIFITTCINIILFLMTAYNIWRIKQGVSQHHSGESRRNKKDETRFNIYLKLSLVMGVNWILEVVSTIYHTDSPIWYISDILNCLSGVLIFVIFVCKRSVIVILCKRFSIENDFVRRWQPVESSRNESSRLNSTSKRKMQDSFATDTSDVEETDKNISTQTMAPKKY